jgi:hypothetical protein
LTQRVHTFTFWSARCLTDSSAYSLRAETKRQVEDRLKRRGLTKTLASGGEGFIWISHDKTPFFQDAVKVEIHYLDRMDFVEQLLGEAG